MTLHRRWMLALAAFTLAVTALFGLFAMVFVYSVEDLVFTRLLAQEAQSQRAHRQAHGRWGPTGVDFVVLHESSATLPPEVADVLAEEPQRLEIPGRDGRHYHLMSLVEPGQAPWLVAEVSQQLFVRPIRHELLGWLAGWGLFTVGLALGLAWWLARRVTAPLESLAVRVSQAVPTRLPQSVSGHVTAPGPTPGPGTDEVAAVARAFDALLLRTHAFIAREQAFTRDASHELRTPLTVLQLGIERLQADTRLPASARATLSSLHAATRWMQQTIETLLVLARESDPSAPPPAPAALLPLLEQWALAHAEWLDQQRLTLDVQLQREARLALPAEVLRLALASLLGNAFVHGAPGGQVTVRFQGGALEVENPLSTANGEPDAESPRSGHGFGRVILQRLLEAAGGALDIEQAEGRLVARVRVQDRSEDTRQTDGQA